MAYVDGFLLAVKTARKDEYVKMAEEMWDLFRDHGATGQWECWGDDVPDGKVTSFPMAVKKEPDETVVFSWITWTDKAARDAGMKAAMEDPRMSPDQMKNAPFDGMRMIFGGFEPVFMRQV